VSVLNDSGTVCAIRIVSPDNHRCTIEQYSLRCARVPQRDELVSIDTRRFRVADVEWRFVNRIDRVAHYDEQAQPILHCTEVGNSP
jgi:hypothetical protein